MTQVQGLEREISVSDRSRARLVGIVFFVVAALFVVIELNHHWFVGGSLEFLARVNYWLAALVLAVLGAYEFGYRAVSGFFLQRGTLIPLPARIVNATIESSVATFLLVLLCQVVPPTEAFSLPPVFAYFPFLALSTMRLDPIIAVYAGLVSGLELTILAAVTSGPYPAGLQDLVPQVAKAGLIVFTGIILGLVTRQIRLRVIGLLRSQEQQNRMASIFGQHVSPAVMEKLLDQQAGSTSEVRHVTVLFLDIRNFTTFSESRTPDQVVDYLNRLFGSMVDCVNAHNGIINKFLGDGFMAIFGAPLDDGQSEANAVRAALSISDSLQALLNDGLEPTRIGMGLHSGEAVTGNVGSTRRQEYTIIGDVVNLASRIESQTKTLGAEILMSAVSWEAARSAWEGTAPEAEPVGPVIVKGREQAVDLVRIR